ncbi:putative AT hook, DNA-binding protein [Helianthus annuus]|nr:putative AT hook, DNA-binding protein [Helianthus annuus]
MDPITTDPPPITTDHFPGHPPPATTHPPYAEMITAAITALKDKESAEFVDFSVEPVVASENVNTNTPVVVKRGRGRPPKSASASGGQAVVSGSEVQGQVAGTGSDGGGGVQGVEVALGRPGRKANGVRVKRGRGRPKRIGFGAVTVPLSGNLLRPRGRPKRAVRQKVTAVNGGAGESVLGSRRRGRPSRNAAAGLVGKSFGSISKGGPGTAVLVTDPEQLVVYQELKSKYEHLQSKVKQVASMVKSCIDPDFGNTALGALQELEDLAAEVNGGARGQTHEPATAS